VTALVRATTFVGYRALVQALGGVPEDYLRQCHIDPALLDAEEGVVRYRAFITLLEVTAAGLGCPDFGRQLARKQGFLNLGPIALIVLNSPTIGDAYRAMSQHLNFHSPAIRGGLDIDTDPAAPRLLFDINLSGSFPRQQADELAVGNLLHQMQIMTHGAFVPRAILFRHLPLVAPAAYRDYFRCEVEFGQEVTALVLQPGDLTYRLDNVDPQLQQLVADYVRQAAANHPLDIGAQVRFLVRRLLPSGCGIRAIARNLCVHERTLQRQLSELGLVYRDLVDEVRRAKAEELLTQSNLSMAQITAALGYREQTSFNRACARWFGASPGQVRRGL
jgi:AraC-like DNA-binding protein